MSSSEGSSINDRSTCELIDDEKKFYIANLSPPDPDWPRDITTVYRELRPRIFKMGLEAQAILNDCGIKSHNIYARFRYFVGFGIKEFIVHHRLQLAQRLLRYNSISISQVALALGYASPNGFSTTSSDTKAVHRGRFETSKRDERT